MTTIFPLQQSFKLVNAEGRYTPEFKRYLDDMLARVFGTSGGSFNPLADAATITWDVGLYPSAYVILGGNRALASPTGMVAGPLSLYRLTVIQDGTGGRTLTSGGAYKFAGGVKPTISAGANAVDEFVFDSDGTNFKLVGGAQNYG